MRQRALIGLGFLAVVIGIFVLGKTTNLLDFSTIHTQVEAVAASPWALPALIIVFCISAFIGIPQFALIAMAVAIFGPWLGALFAWIANMVSGALTFWVGRIAGEKTFKRYAGATANRLSSYVGRNAFLASAIVRNVPAGPFLIVNMAFGVSHARFLHYWAGMGLGVLPKIALIAFAGQSLAAAITGNPLTAIIAALAAIAVYVGIALYARNRARNRQSVALIDDNPVDSSANELD